MNVVCPRATTHGALGPNGGEPVLSDRRANRRNERAAGINKGEKRRLGPQHSPTKLMGVIELPYTDSVAAETDPIF